MTLTRVLSELKIPYAVMGGLAVRVYAIPRFTKDVDLTISVDREQLPKLFDALEVVGCEIPPAYRSGWLDSVAGLPLFKTEMYENGHSIEVDLFVAETDFQQELINRRREIDIPEGRIAFASPEDLILLKLLASRPRDLIDVQDILFTMGQLDTKYMERWASKLAITEPLRNALEIHKKNDEPNI